MEQIEHLVITITGCLAVLMVLGTGLWIFAIKKLELD
jgi:hypothetical protein